MNTILNYILTLKLDTEKYQENILNKRLEISRQIYNSCLGQLYKRYNHMRESKEYKKVVKMTKGKERNKKFNELNILMLFLPFNHLTPDKHGIYS